MCYLCCLDKQQDWYKDLFRGKLGCDYFLFITVFTYSVILIYKFINRKLVVALYVTWSLLWDHQQSHTRNASHINVNCKCGVLVLFSFCFSRLREYVSLHPFLFLLVWSIQIKNILAPGIADPRGAWKKCKLDIKNCSPSQLQTMHGEHQNPSFIVEVS